MGRSIKKGPYVQPALMKHVEAMNAAGKKQVIKAQVPLAEMAKYTIDLKSMTQGRGKFRMEFSHYEEVPAQNAEKIIEKARREREEMEK